MPVRFKQLKVWVDGLTLKVRTLYYCSLDDRMPWLAKAIAIILVAYVLSPIDLIPDFIPVLGLLDDLLILPAGLWLAIRLIPEELWQESLQRAQAELPDLKSARVAAFIIAGIWISIALMLGYQLWGLGAGWQSAH